MKTQWQENLSVSTRFLSLYHIGLVTDHGVI